MRYNVYKDGEFVNLILADEDFCKAFCEENGYTYELEPDPEPEPVPEPEATTDDVLNALLGVTE